jgi:hypothetical protein
MLATSQRKIAEHGDTSTIAQSPKPADWGILRRLPVPIRSSSRNVRLINELGCMRQLICIPGLQASMKHPSCGVFPDIGVNRSSSSPLQEGCDGYRTAILLGDLR